VDLGVQQIESDPNVLAALREGRHAGDIWLVECPECGVPSYWNQGSHATCRQCNADLSDLTDEAFTLEDYWDYEPYPCDRAAAQGEETQKS
jgi:endogenous inhibitor of DNA gyrase (YacG/DUF329 family)